MCIILCTVEHVNISHTSKCYNKVIIKYRCQFVERKFHFAVTTCNLFKRNECDWKC